MRDPKYYAHPMDFDGFRFAERGKEGFSGTDKDKPFRFTDVDHSFPIWGAGKLAWLVNFPENLSESLNGPGYLLRIHGRYALGTVFTNGLR